MVLQFPGITAPGGVINDYSDSGNLYRAHIFTSSGTFTVSDLGILGTTVEYLVVAGGSAGGGGQSGGGGAGGLRTNLPGVVDASPSPLTISTPFAVTAGPTSYVVTVGSGGGGGIGQNPGVSMGLIHIFVHHHLQMELQQQVVVMEVV